MITNVGVKVPYPSPVSSSRPYAYWDIPNRFYYLDDNGQQKALSVAEGYRLFGDLINAKVEQERDDWETARSLAGQYNYVMTYTFLPYIQSWSGTPDPMPPNQEYSIGPEGRSNNPGFDKAVKSGKIIVSDYLRGSCVLRPKPVISKTGLGGTEPMYVQLHNILGTPRPEFSKPVEMFGRKFTVFPDIVYRRQNVSTVKESAPTSVTNGESILPNLVQQLVRHEPTITECVASANAGVVDLSTSLAELPQTLKSLVLGCISIVTMYKEAQRREFRIMNRVKKIRSEWDLLKSRQENLSEREIAAILTREKQLARTIQDLISSISQVWLQFRLNIHPTALVIEDTIDGLVLGKAFTRFVRTREYSQHTMTLNGATVPYEFRCMVKRSLKPAREWQQFFSANLVRTSWELIPLSFILDRYLAVGDWISANLSNPSAFTHDEGSTISWKINTDFSLPDCMVHVNVYKRTVINANDYCRIYLPTSRSMFQHMDHAAILWGKVTKTLLIK